MAGKLTRSALRRNSRPTSLKRTEELAKIHNSKDDNWCLKNICKIKLPLIFLNFSRNRPMETGT